jgi:hypothetical protein
LVLPASIQPKRARIVEVPPARRNTVFWYRLVVVDGPIPAGMILRHVAVRRLVVPEGTLEIRPDPEGSRHAIERLELWALVNGWTVIE